MKKSYQTEAQKRHKTGKIVDDKGNVVTLGGGRYTPGGTGRNASTGDAKPRKQTIPRVKKTKQTTQKASKETLDDIKNYTKNLKKTGGTPEEIARRTNYKKYQGQSISNSKPKDATTEKMDSYLKAGKLSKSELKEAKKLVKEEQKKNSPLNHMGDKEWAYNALSRGTEEYNRQEKLADLQSKTSGQFAQGAMLPFLKATNLLVKGAEKVTGTQDTKGAKELNKQFNKALDRQDLAAEQAPIKHGAGYFAGNALMYSATNPAFDALATKAGVTSAAGKFLVNQLGQNAQDVVLDTLPTYQRLKDQGLTDSEIKSELAKNIAFNAGGNVAIPALGKGLGWVMNKTGASDALAKAWQRSGANAVNKIIPNLDTKYTGDATNLTPTKIGGYTSPEVAERQAIDELDKIRAMSNKQELPSLAQKFDGNSKVISQLGDSAKVENPDIPSYDSAKKELDDILNNYTDKINRGQMTDADWTDAINRTSDVAGRYNYDDSVKELAIDNLQKLQRQADNVNIPKVNDEIKYIDNGYEYSDPDGLSMASSKDIVDEIRGRIDSYNGKEIHPTTRKALNDLSNALDELETAYRTGENFDGANGAYETYRKAMNRVKHNMKVKEGDSSWEEVYKSTLGLQHPDNLYTRYKTRATKPNVDSEGFLETTDEFDDMFDNMENKVIPEDTGLNNKRGVNVSLRNTDDLGGDKLVAEQKVSKVRTNALENSGVYTDDELKNVVPEEDFKYITQSEPVSYEAAQARVDNDLDGCIAQYTQDFNKDNIADIRNAQDIDTMMLTIQRVNEAARNTTDPVYRKELNAVSRKIALNLRKTGTGAGQTIQAFAKWTRTPEGAVTSAQGFAEEMVENGLKGNPKMANEIKDVTNEISSFLDEMDESAMTRQEIEDMIRDAISRRAQLRKRVTNGDIHKIADAILNDRQYADIQKELEYLATGYEDVDAETLEQVQDIFERAYDLDFNSKERVDLENEAYKLLANKIVPNGGSFRDKLDAWRYLAMLANPTTHIKNITGNELFGQGMVSAKNAMAALLEEGADRVSKATGGNGIERTKAILTTADKDLIDAANNDALQNAYRELSGNKYYSTGEGIDKAIQPFSNKKLTGRALNKAAEFNTNLLNAEDEMAVIAKYRTSLAGFLKANGADASIFNATDNASKSLLESGRQYAINQAKEAAFHQDSAVASWLSGISRTARESNSNTVKALGFAGDIVVPFKKTPINILKSAIEYSPAEYFKVATDIPKLNKGLMKPAEFIDDISKATTGTAALGIGALLAHEGILKIGSSKSDEEQAFDKNTGRQNVAIKAGNKYVGMSELIPAAAPLILGATIFETMADSKGDENALNTIFSGMSAVANGVTDMTMLSGIADTLNSIRFAKDKSEVWQKLGIDTMSNLASQMLPTLGRKIETTIDDTKRSTYSDQTGALKTIDQELKYLQTKIPGLQQAGEALQGSSVPFLQAAGNRLALEPNIDVKGQVQNSPGVGGMDNALGRIVNNFISPVPITEDQSTVYDDERRRLAEATGETAVLPYIASKEATIDDIQLTPEEWTQYRQARGQMREDVATSMIDSDFYKNASDADKTKLLTDIDTFTKNYTQSKYGKALSGPDQKLAEIYEKEGTQGLIKTFIGKDIAASSDISGNTKVAGRIQTAVKNNDIKAAQEIASDTGIITGAGLTPAVADAYQDAKQRIPSLTANNYVAMFKKVDKDGNGSLKQDEIIDAMNRDKKNASTYEKAFWTSDSKKPQKVDGQYKATSTKSGKSKGKAESKTEGKSAKENNKERIKELNGGGDIQSQLASYGAIDSETTVKYYNHAKQTIPSLTPKQYANKLHEIGGDDYKIQQTDMLSYFDKTNPSQEEAMKYWNAYGDWSTIPYLKKDGTWGKKKR